MEHHDPSHAWTQSPDGMWVCTVCQATYGKIEAYYPCVGSPSPASADVAAPQEIDWFALNRSV
jgi:hypothetical protein